MYDLYDLTQWENFRIFLSLRFYVKSILANLDRSVKTAVFAILEAKNFSFW